MKILLEQSVVKPQLSGVQCNRCARTVEKEPPGYFQDHISLTKMWGYHSPYDGESHDIDLCVDCYADWIGEFEIPPYSEAARM